MNSGNKVSGILVGICIGKIVNGFSSHIVEFFEARFMDHFYDISILTVFVQFELFWQAFHVLLFSSRERFQQLASKEM